MPGSVTASSRVVVPAAAGQAWQAVVDWPASIGGSSQPACTVARVQVPRSPGEQGSGPLGFTDTMVITGWEPPRRCVVNHLGPLVRGDALYGVRPADAASQFNWTEQLQLPMAAAAHTRQQRLVGSWRGGGRRRRGGARLRCPRPGRDDRHGDSRGRQDAGRLYAAAAGLLARPGPARPARQICVRERSHSRASCDQIGLICTQPSGKTAKATASRTAVPARQVADGLQAAWSRSVSGAVGGGGRCPHAPVRWGSSTWHSASRAGIRRAGRTTRGWSSRCGRRGRRPG